MAMTLTEAAKYKTNELVRGVVETIASTSPVLERLPMKRIGGNAYTYNKEDTLPGVEFRAVNAAYAESTGVINPATESLVILGGDSDVDKFIVATQGGGQSIGDIRASMDTMKAKAVALKYTDAFINGDTAVDANSFDGLKKRLTGAQVISVAGANGTGINTDDASRHAFFDLLAQLRALVPGATAQNSAYLMNASILGQAKGAMRRLTIAQTTLDAFGRNVAAYDDIPMLDIGNKGDGTAIIPQTETKGSSNVTSSVYLVKFGDDIGEQGVTGIQNNDPDAYDLGELQTKPVFRTRIDWYTGLAVFSGRAAARLTGVLNS